MAASFWWLSSSVKEPPWKSAKDKSWFRLAGMPWFFRVERKLADD
jgi:hypothetical protein